MPTEDRPKWPIWLGAAVAMFVLAPAVAISWPHDERIEVRNGELWRTWGFRRAERLADANHFKRAEEGSRGKSRRAFVARPGPAEAALEVWVCAPDGPFFGAPSSDSKPAVSAHYQHPLCLCGEPRRCLPFRLAAREAAS